MSTSNHRENSRAHDLGRELEKLTVRVAGNQTRIARIEAENTELLARAAKIADELGEIRKARASREEKTPGCPNPDEREISRHDVYARIGTALRVSDRTVARWVDQAETLAHDYPTTLRVFATGKISKAHTTVITDAGVIITEDKGRAHYEKLILPIAETESVNRVRDLARRLAERFATQSLDDRAREAREGRQVKVQPLEDDLALVTATLPHTEATAMVDRLTRMAWQLWRHNRSARNILKHRDKHPGDYTHLSDEHVALLETSADDNRTVAQIKADLLIDLVLTGGPTAHVTGGRDSDLPTSGLDTSVTRISDPSTLGNERDDRDDPDERTARAMRTLTDWFNTSALASVTAHVQVIIPLMSLLPEEHLEKLRQIPGFEHVETLPGLQDTPAVVGAGPISHETARFLAGTAPGWDRLLTHPVTGIVEQVDRYQPTQSLKRALRARDEHCRFPGCRVPARRCEIDHTVDWFHGGRSRFSNLAHLCPRHHRVKHHTDWRVTQHPGGILEWTCPTGNTYIDQPVSRVRFAPADPPPF